MDRHAPKRLGEKLLRIRESFGDSQVAFLERLGNPEAVTQKSISGYERGQREPPLLILLQYAKTANIFLEILVEDSLNLPNEIPSKEKFGNPENTI